MKKSNLTVSLKKIFNLLRMTEPVKDEFDVAWNGPYFIPSKRKWYPSHFVLYNRHLYCQLQIEGDYYDLSWKLGSNKCTFEQGWGSHDYYMNDEFLWGQALSQIYERLKKAVKNLPAYNRYVAKNLPLACHTGKINRHFTWEKEEYPLPMEKIIQLEKAVKIGEQQPKLNKMTLSMYLKTTAIAYDAGFRELRPFSPLKKYKKRADGRHGGLLDIPINDSKAFENWYHSGRWSGSHPWEIVFGHPHGIMIAPYHHQEINKWNYVLWVDSLGWYVTAALMAIALAEKKIPFEFRKSEEVLAALQGLDEVEIGPGYPMTSILLLKETRPDAVPYISWDPIPKISLISKWQKVRLKRAMKFRR